MKYTITITKRNLNSGVFCSLSTRGQLLIAIPLSDEDANAHSLAELNSMFAPLKKDIQKTLHSRGTITTTCSVTEGSALFIPTTSSLHFHTPESQKTKDSLNSLQKTSRQCLMPIPK